MTHKTSGTKEWSEKSLNIYYNCEHNCTYCYAKRIALHYKRILTPEEWGNMILNEKAFNAPIQKRKLNKTTGKYEFIKWYMFPTTHDITPSNVDICLEYIKRVLRETVGNILIVSKPHFNVIKKLCNNLIKYKHRILFRFTITSISNETLKEYEPNAPDFDERFKALRYASFMGYKTSVSIEPFLDKDPFPLILKIHLWINVDIWLGIMSGRNHPFHTEENLKSIIRSINTLPSYLKNKIRLKDSIFNKYQLKLN